MLGQSLAVKKFVRYFLRDQMGVDPRIADAAADIAKWIVRIKTFDVGGHLVETSIEQQIENGADFGIDQLVEKQSLLDDVSDYGMEEEVVGFVGEIDPLQVQSWLNDILSWANHPFIPILADGDPSRFAFIENGANYLWGDEVIHYSPTKLAEIQYNYGPGAVYGILAHEVGHSCMGVNVPHNIADWSDELNADYFSGAAMARYGHNIQEYLNFAKTMLGGQRHAPGELRALAVLKGFVNWGGKYQ